MIVGHRFQFSAAHRLWHHKGACNQLHGHTWTVEIQIEGMVDSKTRMVIDFSIVKGWCRYIHNTLDHSYLNEVLNMDDPTAESIAEWIAQRMNGYTHQKKLLLKSVTVWESDNSYARWS